jgi:hypothetical protein
MYNNVYWRKKELKRFSEVQNLTVKTFKYKINK